MKKRLLTLLLAAVLTAILASLPAAAAGFAGGSGTRSDPFLIVSAEQLALFRDLVNSGDSSLCAKLTADIDLGGTGWEPIGLTGSGYTGLFDGCGHLVSGLRLDSISPAVSVTGSNGDRYTYQVTGLFGVIGAGGTVRCTGTGGTVTGTIEASSGTGVYIGSLAGLSFGRIEECFSTCSFENLSVSNNNFIGIGGLVGITGEGSAVSSCCSTGSMTVSASLENPSHRIYAGGLAGLADGRLENSYAAVPMQVNAEQGTLRLGGVCGNGGGNDISNCHYDSQICPAAAGAAGCRYDSSSPYNPPGCQGRTTADLCSESMPGILGGAFRMDTQQVNRGYPVLSVMTYGTEEENWSQWFEDEASEAAVDRETLSILTPPELQNRDLTMDISRVEFCAAAVKLYEEMGGQKLEASQLKMPFEDTSADAVKKAYALGLVTGISGTQFDPYSSISRQDMATMLTRVWKVLNIPGWTLAEDASFPLDTSGVEPFADDASISVYAKPSVYFMVKNGIIRGVSSGVFAPRNVTAEEKSVGYANVTREQALAMAVRMYRKL